MKLKEYNSENTVTIKTGKPTIRFNAKGLISISVAANDIIKAKDKSKCLFHQDEERPKDWYLEMTEDNKGFTMKKTSNLKSPCLNIRAIVKNIGDSIGMNGSSSFVCLIGQPQKFQDKTLFPIITKYAESQKDKP